MTGIIPNHRFKSGLTLIEAMIALVVVTIVSMGALSYQYHGARHFRMARAELTATQIGSLVLEDWKSVGGVDSYRVGGVGNHNPVSLNLGFTGSGGNYQIRLNGITYYITLLAPQSIDANPYAGNLWNIKTTIQWRNDFGPGSPEAGDPALTFTTYGRGQD